MPATIRAASREDVPGIAALLSEDARRRSAANPLIWRWNDSVPERIARALAAQFGAEPSAALLLVAEAGGRMAGFARAMKVPVPPIYDPGVTPGLLLDDCCTTPDAPAGTDTALIAATEAALAEAGANSFIASSDAGSAWHHACEASGYDTVTLYLAGQDFGPGQPESVRKAEAEDVPGIVALSAEHRAILQALNPRFWRTHKEADQRFGLWMGYSRTLPDRDMLVAEREGGVAGYIIAQPCPDLHMPLAHDPAGIGIIDDFHARDFSDVRTIAGGATAAALLAAAKGAFARRGTAAALAICPAGWPSKRAFLEERGYRTAKVWMLKRD